MGKQNVSHETISVLVHGVPGLTHFQPLDRDILLIAETESNNVEHDVFRFTFALFSYGTIYYATICYTCNL